MSLRDRLNAVPAPPTGPAPGADEAEAPSLGSAAAYQAVKAQLHQALVRRLDLEVMSNLSAERVRDELKTTIERLVVEDNLVLNGNERRQLVKDLQDEMMGLGPIEPLLADPTVSDILINTYAKVFVERKGRLELTHITFTDNDHLMKIIDKIVSRVGRRIDESSPMVDARLPDGSRVNAVIPPLAIDGPIVSIRRFSDKPMQMANLLENKSLSQEMALFLSALAEAKVNVLVSGGTGSGKTTLLNVLSNYIPTYERIVTIEDAAELRLQQPHVVRLETRPSNVEGQGAISQRALVKNALRMRPDRIILGEIRGSEAVDMLQAMNTGHEGSMTTIHANTARDSLARLESMIAMAGLDLPPRATRAQVASSIGIIVQANRLSDGTRKVTSITEISGMEGDMITVQELFLFKQTGVNTEGHVQGYFAATGVRSKLFNQMKASGIQLPDTLFHPIQRPV